MLFSELGTILKNKREAMQITEADIAYKLKIPLRSLIALESGNLDELPHETYVRTFIKEYAKYIDFEPDEIRLMLSEVEEFGTHIEPPKSMEKKHAESAPNATKTKGVRIAMQLLFVALIGTTSYFYYVKNERSGNEEGFFSSIFSSSEKSDSDKGDIIKESNNNLEYENQSNVIDDTSADDLSFADVKIVESPETENENPSTLVLDGTLSLDPSVELAEGPVANIEENPVLLVKELGNDDFETFIANTPEASLINWNSVSTVSNPKTQAVIYVTQDCWMHVTTDGVASHFTLRKGNQRELKFKNKLEIKLGNASAVTLFHGRDLVDVGDSKVLRTITLNAK